MRGLVIGKFYPPHNGHHFLIDTAISECNEVVVMVLANDVESIPKETRAAWLQARHPSARILAVTNNLAEDYTSREVDKQHAQLIYDALRRAHVPDLTRVYSSEMYGERLAEDLSLLYGYGCEGPHVTHRMVDLKRIAIPFSARKFRENPIAHWNYLAPDTKAGLTKRVIVCGAESTGTTTLTRALAARYQTVAVPEFGRTYSEALGAHYVWSSDDFAEIMIEQRKSEDYFARKAGPVLFADTDGIATCLFHALYMRAEAPQEQWEKALAASSDHILYLLTDHEGVPFDQDGYRLFPNQRRWATDWFITTFERTGLPYLKVSGAHEERMDTATERIDSLLHWDISPPQGLAV